MIKKLIVAAMLIATLGIGCIAYAQRTTPTMNRQAGPGGEGRPRAQRHRRGHRAAVEYRRGRHRYHRRRR
jgi:hypothetical protein